MHSILAIVLMLVATPCLAQQGNQGTIVFGNGNNSCGLYLEAAEQERSLDAKYGLANVYHSGKYASYVSWADGYLTALNALLSSNLGQQTDVSGRMRWIENYCQSHPIESFVFAVIALYGDLKKMSH